MVDKARIRELGWEKMIDGPIHTSFGIGNDRQSIGRGDPVEVEHLKPALPLREVSVSSMTFDASSVYDIVGFLSHPVLFKLGVTAKIDSANDERRWISG